MTAFTLTCLAVAALGWALARWFRIQRDAWARAYVREHAEVIIAQESTARVLRQLAAERDRAERSRQEAQRWHDRRTVATEQRNAARRAAAAPAQMPAQAPTLGWRCPRCDGEYAALERAANGTADTS